MCIDFTQKDITVNSENYFNTLQKLKTRIRRVRRTRIIFYLRHDNARLQRTKKTRDKIDRVNFKVVPRPANSTNLPPNKFHPFSILKESILGINLISTKKKKFNTQFKLGCEIKVKRSMSSVFIYEFIDWKNVHR